MAAVSKSKRNLGFLGTLLRAFTHSFNALRFLERTVRD